MPAAPQEVWASLASEAPLGKMGSAARRAKRGAQGQPAPEVILVHPGPPERGRTESRDSVGHLAYLDLLESRGTEAHLGSLAYLAPAETRAPGLLALLALRARLDPWEIKDPRDREAYLESPDPRDQLATMGYQAVREEEGRPASQASLHCCLRGT